MPTEATTDERLAANQEVIDRADLSAWLPRYRVTGDDGISEGQVGCDAVHRPPRYTGTSMVTVLTFDLSAPVLGSGDPVSVVADGDTVYATGSSLYVASDRRWWAEPLGEIGGRGRSDQQTEIYKFDLSQPGPPRYVASGAVEGWLLNQYALSEWDGHLRVATTLETFGEAPVSESAVTVLEQRGERLVPVGSVTGLREGELIYSVRFVGPTGYVVTFRQVDPLYTLDLSDPAAPARLGELKITGYSAYLHPIDAGRLIGVGQEADTSGRTLGTQVSLFDVSDLRDPIRLAQHHMSGGRSEAEFDPHAFLWWPAERLLVLPLVTYRVGEPAAAAGALVLRVEDDAVAEVATNAHPGVTSGAPARRSCARWSSPTLSGPSRSSVWRPTPCPPWSGSRGCRSTESGTARRNRAGSPGPDQRYMPVPAERTWRGGMSSSPKNRRPPNSPCRRSSNSSARPTITCTASMR